MLENWIYFCALPAAAGFILDLIFGDPKSIPHPVVIIGRLISFFEKRLLASAGVLEAMLGALTLLVVILAAAEAVRQAKRTPAGQRRAAGKAMKKQTKTQPTAGDLLRGKKYGGGSLYRDV